MALPRYFSRNIVTTEVNLPDVDPPAVLYFANSKTLLASYINNVTATFSKGFAVPVNGLPAPTANNFDFYINGTLIERIGIVSFIDNITTSTLTINPTILGFSFESTDKIIGIGKFN